NIQMTYWQAIYPECVETINYSIDAFNADEKYLCHLMQQIISMKEDDFLRTNNERVCSYCNYRSLCDRGIVAGSYSDTDADPEQLDLSTYDFDLDQIEEISY
ncbi:MAG: PD-(D/E)XK nuclease family protein, partial [Anaerolineaceae bacterium]|nr:PD-(D/E)XK nuclease family protein [Anaerolineaceae bacterium]